MPYVKAFIITLLLSVVLTVILAVLIYGVNLLFKNAITVQQAVCTASMRSLVLLPIIVLAIILVFFNVGLGVAVFYLANIWGVCMVITTMPQADEHAQNYSALTVFIIFVIFVGVSFLIMRAAYGVYLPDSWNSNLDGILSYLF